MTQPRARRQSWAELPPVDWGERQAKSIADEVKRLRGKNSAQWLADRTKELGYEVSRSVISDLENGRRRYVTTAELIVLAAALNTSPVTLVYPGPYNNPVDVLPYVECEELDGAQWFSGLGYLPIIRIDDSDTQARQAWLDNTHNVRRFRDLQSVHNARQRVVMRAEFSQEDRELIAMYDKQIAELMEELGISYVHLGGAGDDDA